MQLKRTMIQFSLNRPQLMTSIMVTVTLVSGFFLLLAHVDTEPKSVLSAKEMVRIFHDRSQKEFNLHDVVVLGVINQKDKDGAFNPKTLTKVYQLSRFAAGLSDAGDPDQKVIGRDIIAPDNVDAIEQAGLGQVRFQWLMPRPPTTRKEALRIRDKALDNPLLKGTMISEDGRALALYLPISHKDFARQLSRQLKKKIEELGAGDDRFYIAGLPVAEDTFGRELLIQLAVFIPPALLLIFLLTLVFLKKIKIAISPIIITLCTVISTMGLLIGAGNTLHLINSMIPIFIMPVALAGAIRILSEFSDQYQKTKDRRATIEQVMHDLFKPMLFTSLTSSAGFASLVLIPIHSVQVFGLFVAIGIMLAWLLTTLFIPAHVMLVKEKSLENFGAAEHIDPFVDRSLRERHLRWVCSISTGRPWRVIGVNLAVMGIGVIGILMIQLNNNPVKWFHKSHEIRVADHVLNQHFCGIHAAYLVLSGNGEKQTPAEAAQWLSNTLEKSLKTSPVIQEKVLAEISEAVAENRDIKTMVKRLSLSWRKEIDHLSPEDDTGYEAWSLALDTLDRLRNMGQIFKRPDLLNYIIGLQNFLHDRADVGKSNSIADIVRKVHQELFEGAPDHLTIPTTANGVAQTLISYQESHKPEQLWHLVTPDYTKANLWLQLRSGKTKAMERVIDDIDRFLAENPPPAALQVHWTGPAYINMVLQKKVAKGLMKALFTSSVFVFIMTALLFRSLLWGILAMIPLTFTMTILYGFIGLIGRDYDMPTAALSFLPLGITVDFAIHFLQRARTTMTRSYDWRKTVREMFKAPARAITRNTIILALGFTPLLFAPLVPCQTIAVFLAVVMLSSGAATLWIIPALLTILQKWLLKNQVPTSDDDNNQGREITVPESR